MSAARQISRRKPKLIFDELKFVFDNGEYPFNQDSEVAVSNTSSIPAPPSLTGNFRTEYTNRFLPSFPDSGERRDSIAVAVMQVITHPSENLKKALAKAKNLDRILATSNHKAMRNASDKLRREYFLRGIAAACALTGQEIRIRGAILGNLYDHVNKNLADSIATLLAIHLGTQSGTRAGARLGLVASQQLLNVTDPKLLQIDAKRIVRRLSSQYADFKIYYRTLTAQNESIAHIIGFENGDGSMSTKPVKGPPRGSPPGRNL